MGLVDGLKKAVEIAGEQLTSSSPQPQAISFTTNFQQKAKAWGLSGKDASPASSLYSAITLKLVTST